MSIGSVANRRRPLVLCVEDNHGNAELVRMIFRSQIDANLIIAESGEAGVEMATSRLPDLILMDIKLPGICGVEATRSIRSIPDLADVPIIAMTAGLMDIDKKRVELCEFAAHIEKPFKVSTFVQTVRLAFSGQTVRAN